MNIKKSIQFMAVAAAVSVGASAGFASAAFAADFGSHSFGSHSFGSHSFGSHGSVKHTFSSQVSGSSGEASKPASVILADAKRTTLGAKTALVSGAFDDGGKSYVLDAVAGHGQGSGSVGINGTTFHVVVHGQKTYVEASKASWYKLSQNSEAAQLLGGKWIEMSTSGTGNGYAQAVSLPTIIGNASGYGTLTNAGTTTFDGQSAIDLKAQDGTQVYVAAQGPTYLLGVVHPLGGGQVTLSDFNTARVAPAPQGAESLSAAASGGF